MDFDFNNYENIELDSSISPCDLCVLDNDHILLTNYKERKLVLFDKNFKQIKKITKIISNELNSLEENVAQEELIGSVCIDINDQHDCLYISDYNNHKVFKSDLNFNQLNVTEGNNENNSKFKHPFGICYYNNSVYVCDCSNKRIQKLNAINLDYEATYNLDFKPWRIKIGNNVACVRATLTNPSINFYNLDNNFQLLIRYNDHNGVIGYLNNRFYEYFGPTKKLYVYNSSNGKIENEIETNGLGLGDITSRNGTIVLFNNNIIIGSHDSQKLSIIKSN